MIKLQKTETIDVYQVELCRNTREKESPFIAILIYAKELLLNDELIFAHDVRDNLFPILKEGACENLLERLSDLNYFTEEWDGNPEEDNAEFLGYRLTNFGEKCAQDKAFWVGEKGLYKLYVASSPFINQRIILVEESKDKINDESASLVPKIITSYENKIIELNGIEVQLTNIENKCYQMESAKLKLEILANETGIKIQLVKEEKIIYENDAIGNDKITADEILSEILENTNEHHYDKNNKAVKVYFDKSNLQFNRDIVIRRPEFNDFEFEPIKIGSMKVIPIDRENAVKWYYELLIRNINYYVLSETEFDQYALKQIEYLKQYFDIKPVSREMLLKEHQIANHFYKKAKLETIDYLSY